MDMIERVAKAIYEARNGPKCLPWAQQIKSHKAPYLADARAAIEAMREPTEAMVEAVYMQSDPGFCDEPGTPTAPDDAWRQMIDAALSHEGK